MVVVTGLALMETHTTKKSSEVVSEVSACRRVLVDA
jgi:hypothetical protein